MRATCDKDGMTMRIDSDQLREGVVFMWFGQDITVSRIVQTERQVMVVGYFADGGPGAST